MADAVIGSAYLQVIPKLSFHSLSGSSKDAGQQAAQGFTGGFSGEFGKTSAALKKGFDLAVKAAVAGSTAAADGISAVTVAAIKGFSEYEQLAGGAEKIFDQMDFGTIAADAQQAYKTMGMSANEYLESINQTGAAFAATMGDQKGYETAKRGMQAIADYASGTGRSVDELNEKYSMITRSTSSYQSIADQFSGILPATSQGFLEQAQAAGLLSEEYTSLTEVPIDEYQQAVTGMLEKGTESLGLTGNTAREATETISGSISMLKSSWSNFVTELGKDDADIEARTGELVDSVIAVAENVIPRAVEIVGKVMTQVPAALAAHAPQLMQAVTSMLDSVTGGAFSKMVEAITPYAERIGTAVHGMMERFAPLAPVVSDIAGKLGGIFMTAVQGVTAGVENLAPIIATIAEHALPILSSALGVASDAFDAITTVMEPVGTFLSETLSAAIDWIGEKLEQLAEFVETCFSGIGEAADAAADFLKDPIGGIGKLFTGTGKEAQSTQKTVTKSFDGMGKSVGKSASSLSSNVSSSMKSMDKATSSAFSSMSTDASKQMGSMASTATDKMGKVASTVDSKTRDAQSKAAANSAAMQRDLAAKMEAIRADSDAKMAKLAAQTNAQMAAAKANAAKQAEAMRTSLSTSFNNAANDANSKAQSIKNAWDKSYTMKVNATADTSKATSTLTTFRNSWNGYNINGTATNNPGSANSSLWGLWNDWNGSTFRFYSSASTYDADSSFASLYYKWNNSKVHFIASGGNAAGGIFSAAGAIVQKHADGFIADRPGRGVDITRHIAGEAGGEAIIPLTNKHYVRPFAETVASFIDGGNGGVDIHDCTFVVRQESDIAAIGRAINREADRQRRARL